MVLKIKKTIFAASSALISFNADAALTPYNVNGVDLVYSSVSDVTWTKNSNMLGNLFASQGFEKIADEIITATPTIANTPNYLDGYSGTYTLTTSDFDIDGRTTWFGALAYVNYLNTISYGGSNNWYLPTTEAMQGGDTPFTNGKSKGGELAELHFPELYEDSTGGFSNPSNYFNVEYGAYWYGTETSPSFIPDLAWAYLFIDVRDVNMTYGDKSNKLYAWAVSPGKITSVPEPENIAMLLAGLSLLGVPVRRNRKT